MTGDPRDRHGPVTVLMPVYNAASTVEVAAHSILSQIDVDLELLVIDDGSTDDSLRRIEALGDARVRVESIPHSGIAAALNHGYARIDTPYAARFDADDYSLPDRLAKQMAYLEAHPELDGVGSAVCFFESDPLAPGYFLAKPTTPALFRWELFFGCSMTHSALVVRTQAWRQAGTLRDGLAEDYEFYCRNVERLVLGNLAEALVYIRAHSGQTTVTRAAAHEHAMVEILTAFVARTLGAHISAEVAAALLFPRRLAERQSPVETARGAIEVIEAAARYCVGAGVASAGDAAAISADATQRVRRLVYHAWRASPLGAVKLFPRGLRLRRG